MSEPNYRTSEKLENLFAALNAAQKVMRGAVKDAKNPHFNSKYADLASVWDAARDPLTDNGLTIIQPVSAVGPSITVTTILAHKSGEWIASDLTLTSDKNTPQGAGSAITYGRRFGLSSMVGIAPEDDDGNAAEGIGRKAKQAQQDVVDRKLGGTPETPPTPAAEDAPPPSPPRPQAVPGKSKLFEALKAFRAIKEAVGAAQYYRVLTANGYQKSNEITDEAIARSVYKQLAAVKKAIDAAANGEIIAGMDAEVFKLLPDSSVAAIQREFRKKMADAFGTEVGPQEYEQMRAKSTTNWEFFKAMQEALNEYAQTIGA